MASGFLSVGTTEISIKADPSRTVLIIQNLDTTPTDYLWVSDDKHEALIAGIRLAGQGGQLTLRRSSGEEPEKTWYLVATTAATPVRVIELFGDVSGVTVVHPPTETPTPPIPERLGW